MIFDVVALRDIEVDEEIFIDYGQDWDLAWNTHIEQWKSPCEGIPIKDCEEYSSFEIATAMNHDKHNEMYHRWSDVHLTTCATNKTMPWDGGELVFLVGNISEAKNVLSDPQIQEEFLGFNNQDDGFGFRHLSLSLPNTPCKIVDSDKVRNTFDVVFFIQPDQIPDRYRNGNVPDARALVRYDGLAADGVRFLNKPLKADWHDPKAFRHEIHIPGDVFPPLWKDLIDPKLY